MPKISFGMIVLNGEPFVRYNLRQLYPHAHQIIVVEGAVETATAIATDDGHSLDSTLETLYDFKANEDPDNKLIIITREGFWSEKDEMSQAYADVATGDYLWQVDSDEFYRHADIEAVMKLLQDDPTISAISFKMVTFWGDIQTIAEGWYLKRGAEIFHRLFKWGDGYQYVTHRPPTVVDAQGRDMRDGHWINGYQLEKQYSIVMYHYSLLFPKQVIEKNKYYSVADWAKHLRADALEWTENVYMRLQDPFRVHNVYEYPSWLRRYKGDHPEQMKRMWRDIDNGIIEIERRPMQDVDTLLQSPQYQVQRRLLRVIDYPARVWRFIRLHIVYPIGRRVLPKQIVPLVKKIFLGK